MRPDWNERLGWVLLLAGWAWAIGLDPWSLSERNSVTMISSSRPEARYAQAVVLAMGFLQLAVSLLLHRPDRSVSPHLSWLFLLGSLIYAAGYLEQMHLLGWAGLMSLAILIGAGLNLLGFAILTWDAFHRPDTLEHRTALCLLCFGMILDLVRGLDFLFLDMDQILDPAYDLRQRMLRLARVAAIALPLLVLLFRRWSRQSTPSRIVKLGRLTLVIGCAGMPTILAAASFIYLDLKYLLPIPALATTAGVACALLLARRTARILECWGWLLVLGSISAGLLIGMYAFDGPLPAPPTQKDYHDFYRRLTRLGHAYTIVLGLLAILIARTSTGRWPAILLIAGSCVTLLSLAAQVVRPVPWLLSVGPALVALSLIVPGVKKTPLWINSA